jgi:prenyltransferase beta subunit
MIGNYLDMLDDLLAGGLEGLSRGFVEAQVGFVVARQQADGGFAGRLGSSDLYYTDFALRILTLLAPQHPAVERARGYVAGQQRAARDVVECFSLLNARRLLQRCHQAIDIDEPAMLAVLEKQTLATGGLTRGGREVSAYYTFLGALCYACLRREMPSARDAVRAVMDLRQGDLGFAETAGQGHAQTNATAAAAGFLGLCDALSEETVEGVARYLAGMQTSAGGLRAHGGAGEGDLLSTFTGLLTLATLEQLGRVDVVAVARFIRSVACARGGFRACAVGDEADIEYAYYGLGTLALMRLHGQTPVASGPG